MFPDGGSARLKDTIDSNSVSDDLFILECHKINQCGKDLQQRSPVKVS